MAVSGRDRDPAFRRRQAAEGASKPKPDSKKPTSETGESEVKPNPKSEETKPVVPSNPIEPAKAQEASKPIEKTVQEKPTPVKPVVSKTEKDTLTTPVVEPRVKVEPALNFDEDENSKKPVKTSNTNNDNKNPSKTSKKSKTMGVIFAILVLIGFSFLGYYVINSVMTTEGNQSNAEMSENEPKESDEGTAHAGNVVINVDDSSMTISSETGEEESMRETTLTEENSLEPTSTEDESLTENDEKEALKTVIRKKGDFEIPCWIVAFSANTKKPLANMNYSTLEALGFDAGIYWIPKYFPGDKELYKVYVGPYSSPEEAQSKLPQIRNIQPDAYVMKIDE